MPGQVYWSLELEVREGQGEGVEPLMDEMVATVRDAAPGTLAYKWHRSPDGGSCHLFERFADSDATLAHLALFQERFAPRFFGLFRPVRLTVYGNPSPAVREALAGLRPAYLDIVGGFTR